MVLETYQPFWLLHVKTNEGKYLVMVISVSKHYNKSLFSKFQCISPAPIIQFISPAPILKKADQ